MSRQYDLFYALLRVRIEADGRLLPLQYTVGSLLDFDQATVVNHEYTIAICTLQSRSLEEARKELKANLRWIAPLLKLAEPTAWFTSEDPR
jgi:hypothetical protein